MAKARKIFYSRMQSPAGPLLLAATEAGLFRIQFGHDLPPAAKDEEWIESPEELRNCEQELRAYFRGDLQEFTVKLDLQGTKFQIRCWEALLEIPYGKTSSYGEIAARVGSPKAFRAVGQANHNNPIAIIVPCHRVIGTNGTLTGYGGGLDVKKKLLQLEADAVQTPLAFVAESA